MAKKNKKSYKFGASNKKVFLLDSADRKFELSDGSFLELKANEKKEVSPSVASELKEKFEYLVVVEE